MYYSRCRDYLWSVIRCQCVLSLQEKAGCKMQMIQDGPYANTPEKPLRMTGLPESCKVGHTSDSLFGAV